MDGSDPWQWGAGGEGSRWAEDRELQLRVTGNYFKSLLETALLSQRGRLILRVALPQVADTLACTHECSHVLAAHTHTHTHTRMGVCPSTRSGCIVLEGPTQTPKKWVPAASKV